MNLLNRDERNVGESGIKTEATEKLSAEEGDFKALMIELQKANEQIVRLRAENKNLKNHL